MTVKHPKSCPFCRGSHFTKSYTFNQPPEGEVEFSFNEEGYHRDLYCCDVCGHFLSIHDMDIGDLYSGDYVDSSYGPSGIRSEFDRIIALPSENSDNRRRVDRVCDYVLPRLKTSGVQPTMLDVGSGLGVFPYGMKEAGWNCTALDPDQRSTRHANDVIGINSICGDFMEIDRPGCYDLITFNKVLEHVEDPVDMLARAKDFLNPGGIVYVELPDGENAIHDSPHREEFMIEHPHIFSAASVCLLVKHAGFSVQTLEHIREPSSKYTLFTFLR